MAIYFEDNFVKLYSGHVLNILKDLPDNSVDCVITSPPYYGLRSYRTEPQIWGGDVNCEHEWEKEIIKKTSDNFNAGFNERYGNSGGQRKQEKSAIGDIKQGQICNKCRAWKGELGLEPNIFMYIDHLILVFNEVYRVVKKTGTCWVNIGDSYAGSGGNNERWVDQKQAYGLNRPLVTVTQKVDGVKAKSLCNIPEMFSIAMCGNGWIKRNNIIWQKPNAMPEPVKDRFTDDFEMLYFFVKDRKYYFEQQLDEYSTRLNRWGGNMYNKKENSKYKLGFEYQIQNYDRCGKECRPNKDGKNKRCVWSINTEPFADAHFATFPEALVEIPIKSGCPKDGIVLDIFAGSGTTLSVSKKLNRKSIGIELNSDYCNLCVKRIRQTENPTIQMLL